MWGRLFMPVSDESRRSGSYLQTQEDVLDEATMLVLP